MEVSTVNSNNIADNKNITNQLISEDSNLQQQPKSQSLLMNSKSVGISNSPANNNISNTNSSKNNSLTISCNNITNNRDNNMRQLLNKHPNEDNHLNDQAEEANINDDDYKSISDINETIKLLLDRVEADLKSYQIGEEINTPLNTSVQAEQQTNDQNLTQASFDTQSLSPDDFSGDLVIDASLPPNDAQEHLTQSETSEVASFGLISEQKLTQKPIEIIHTVTAMNEKTIMEPADNVANNDTKYKEVLKSTDVQIEPVTRSHEHKQPDEQKIDDGIDIVTESSENLNPKSDAKEVTDLEATISESSRVNQVHGDDLNDSHEEEKPKDMVILKNLEISPPPSMDDTPDKVEESLLAEETTANESTNRKRKRNSTIESTCEQNQSNQSIEGRSKRQRTQTQLFQAGEAKPNDESLISSISSTRVKSSRSSTKPASRNRKKSTASTTSDVNTSTAQETVTQATNDLQDVIFYDKNDYLAIRNEENSFYLCQIAENVRVKRPLIKVKWLDTKNDGKTYFLTSHYDKIPQKSIIMLVSLNKLKSEKKGEQLFSLDDQDRDNIIERLKRSLNAPTESSSQESS